MHTLYITHHDPPYILMQVVGEIVGVAGGMDGVVVRMYKRLHDRIIYVTIERWYDCVCFRVNYVKSLFYVIMYEYLYNVIH
jgi:hypothetical protein